jgi:hypothetical protein
MEDDVKELEETRLNKKQVKMPNPKQHYLSVQHWMKNMDLKLVMVYLRKAVNEPAEDYMLSLWMWVLLMIMMRKVVWMVVIV